MVARKVYAERWELRREGTIVARRKAEAVLLGEDHACRVLEGIEPPQVDTFPAADRSDRGDVGGLDQRRELAAGEGHDGGVGGDEPLARIPNVVERRLAEEQRAEDLGEQHRRRAIRRELRRRHLGRHFVDDVDAALEAVDTDDLAGDGCEVSVCLDRNDLTCAERRRDNR